MSDKVRCEVFLAINEDGDYEVAPTEDEVFDRFTDNFAGSHRRVVKLTVSITPPEMAKVDLDVPDEAGRVVEAKVADEAEQAES